jgi:gluconate kinase
MGHIKEPDGVDFIIESKPLTDDDRKAISDFIRKDKEKLLAKRKAVKRVASEQLKKQARQ